MRLGAVRLSGEFILGVHDAPSEARHAHAVHSAPTAGRAVKRARSRRSGSSIPSRSFRLADVGEHAADRGSVPRIRLDQLPRAMRMRQPARRRIVDRRHLLRREKGTTCLPAIDSYGRVVPGARPDDERREYRDRKHRTLDQPQHPRRTISRPARDDMPATLRPLGVSDMLVLADPESRGCTSRTRANDVSTRVYRGWEDAQYWGTYRDLGNQPRCAHRRRTRRRGTGRRASRTPRRIPRGA